MGQLLRFSGGLAIQVVTILIAAATLLSLVRDSFHIFVHDRLVWLVAMKQALFDVLFEQPGVSQVVELVAKVFGRVFTLLGVDTNLSPQPHWTYIFVLLAMAFLGYAHAHRDFSARPAASAFRYGNALVCAFLGGVLAGSAPLAHPGMFAWPVASMLAFFGLNAVWQAALDDGPGRRRLAAYAALLYFAAGGLITFVGFHLEPAGGATHPHGSPGLVMLALLALGLAAWAARYGLRAVSSAAPFKDRGRRLGVQVLTVFGVTAVMVVTGQAAFGMAQGEGAEFAPSPGEVFRDCSDCPDMVAIQAGRFLIGTSPEEAERLEAVQLWNAARHTDELPAQERETPSFVLSRTEVTIRQYEAFMRATGYRPAAGCWGLQEGAMDVHQELSWSDPGFLQGPDHPVVCVNWLDAQAYARWLGIRTGEAYRLPTEAEWEYAARAGTQTAYTWGEDPRVGCAFANAADVSAKRAFPEWKTFECDDGATHTAPAGSYAPNGFGLFDMTGNVWEWVQDCYDPHGVETDGADAQKQTCADRVIRGGSWNYGPDELRAANRDAHRPGTRGSGLGFRVARELVRPS